MRVRRRLQPALQRDAPQYIPHALLRDRSELLLALHEQHARKAERVHAQLLARAREHMCLATPRHDVDVLEREENVVRGRTSGIGRVVTDGLDREVERGEEGVCEDGLELVWGGEREGGGKTADVVRIGKRGDAERATWGGRGSANP